MDCKQSRVIIMILCIFIAGCSSYPAKLTHGDFVESEHYKLPRGKASSSSFVLFGLLPFGKNREARARDALLRQSGGSDLINPSVSSSYFWTPIGPFVSFRLEATPIRRHSEVDRERYSDNTNYIQSSQSQKVIDAVPKKLEITTFQKTANVGSKDFSMILKKVQLHLQALKYSPGPADGIMGKRTELAIAKYQQDNGLDVTSVPDKNTRVSLGVEERALSN